MNIKNLRSQLVNYKNGSYVVGGQETNVQMAVLVAVQGPRQCTVATVAISIDQQWGVA